MQPRICLSKCFGTSGIVDGGMNQRWWDDGDKGSNAAVHKGLYLGLAILILLPMAWLIYRASSRRPVSAVPAQVNVNVGVANSEEFLRYTSEGLAHYQKHEWDQADSAFREALKHIPRSAMGLNNLGAVQDERGNYDAAIPIFELALSIDPTLEVARNNLAWAKAHRGEQRK